MRSWSKLSKANSTADFGQRIYTTGFEKMRVTDLPELLAVLDAILIDVRFQPPEKPLEFSKNYLKLLLKNSYYHVPVLGVRAENPNGGTAIQNIALGVKIVRELPHNVVLMCACAAPENCHRRIIAQKLIEQNLTVQEISDWRTVI